MHSPLAMYQAKSNRSKEKNAKLWRQQQQQKKKNAKQVKKPKSTEELV